MTFGTSLVAQLVKNLSALQEIQVQFLVGKTPWRRKWQPTLVFLSGKSHSQLQSMGSQRVRHDLVTKQHLHNKELVICVDSIEVDKL